MSSFPRFGHCFAFNVDQICENRAFDALPTSSLRGSHSLYYRQAKEGFRITYSIQCVFGERLCAPVLRGIRFSVQNFQIPRQGVSHARCGEKVLSRIRSADLRGGLALASFQIKRVSVFSIFQFLVGFSGFPLIKSSGCAAPAGVAQDRDGFSRCPSLIGTIAKCSA